MLANGYIALQPGKLAALVTYLERDLAEPIAARDLPEGLRLEAMRGASVTRYRRLYRRVGQEWLWFSRLRMDEAKLISILDSSHIEALALCNPAGDCGLLELDFREESSPDLSYFGIAPDWIGKGFGTLLMAHGLGIARQRGAKRLRVNTCSLDHPGALAFYMHSGFVPRSRAVEVFDDPRLDGTLDRCAAAHLPLIKP